MIPQIPVENRDQRFFLEVLRSFVRARDGRVAVPRDLDWAWLGKHVSSHRLGPIFKHVVGEDQVPQQVSAQWNEQETITFVRNARALSAAIKISGLLDDGGLPFVILRGLSLASCVYGDLALRPMTDVDILIRPADTPDIRRLLETHGLKPARQLRSQLVYHIDGTVFEMHWSLLTPKRFRQAVDAETFVGARQPVDLPEGRIYCLPPTFELLGLVAHAFTHHQLGLILQLIDIGLVMSRSRLDWKFAADWCHTAQLTRMFLLAITLVNRLFELGQEDKLDVFERSLPTKAARIIEAYAARLLRQDTVLHYLRRKRAQFLVAERPVVKLRQILRLFSPDEISELVRVVRRCPLK